MWLISLTNKVLKNKVSQFCLNCLRNTYLLYVLIKQEKNNKKYLRENIFDTTIH